MTFAESIGTYLHNHSGLAALVGTRIYPVRAPDSPTFPYVTYRIRVEPEDVLTGGAPIDRATITLSAFARTGTGTSGYALAHSVADQLRAALAYFRGTLAASGASSEGSLMTSTEDGESSEFGVFETVTEVEMYYCPS